MNKKGVNLILLISVFSILTISLVSAISLYQGIVQVKDSIAMILGPVVEFLLGDISGGLLLTKILIFTIIILLAWIGMKNINFFEDYPKISKIIILAFALLAMKGIGSSEIINTILLPYTATGVAMSAGLPFLIYFAAINLGLKLQPAIVRRVAWIFFAVIFLGLLISRIGGIENVLEPSSWGIYWIYMVTIILAIAMAFLDGTIKGFFATVEAKKLDNINQLKLLAKLKARKQEYDNARDLLTDSEYGRLIKALQKEAKRYGIKKRI